MPTLRTFAALLLCALSACTTVHLPAQQTADADPERFGNFTDKDARNAQITLASTQLSDGSHVQLGGPYYVYNSTFWVDGESNSDNNSSALDCRNARTACFKVEMTNGSTPVGTLAVQASDDGTNDWAAVYIDENRVYGANFAAFTGGTSISISSPAGAVLIYVCVDPTLPYLRLAYDQSSGGAANTVDATSFIRGM